jgi:hypothetical protein
MLRRVRLRDRAELRSGLRLIGRSMRSWAASVSKRDCAGVVAALQGRAAFEAQAKEARPYISGKNLAVIHRGSRQDEVALRDAHPSLRRLGQAGLATGIRRVRRPWETGRREVPRRDAPSFAEGAQDRRDSHAHRTLGCCWVMQWMVPRPRTRSRQGMPIISRVGKSLARVLRATRSFGSLKVGTRTILLAM